MLRGRTFLVSLSCLLAFVALQQRAHLAHGATWGRIGRQLMQSSQFMQSATGNPFVEVPKAWDWGWRNWLGMAITIVVGLGG
jgi:hypothetical protein